MNPWPITPLGTQDLSFAVKVYDFTGLTASGLTGTPELLGAIDSAAAEFAASVADQTILIASMAHDLDDLGKVLDEMGTDDFEQIAADLAGIAAAGDGILNDFTKLL